MTVPGGERAPSLEEAARHLGVPVDALSSTFGVVLFDPENRRYAVEVDAWALENRIPHEAEGPFSDPPLAPLGRP